MIRISTKGRYGTRFMLELAMNYGKEPVLLKDIAQHQDISEGYLQHIVDTLKGAGLVHSSRVGHGGYSLGRAPDRITLKDVLSTLEGSITLVECVENPEICSRASGCVAREVWGILGKNFSRSLASISLQSMVDMSRGKEALAIHYEI